MEESREPADHYLVSVPSFDELAEEVLVVEVAERWEDGGGEIVVEGLTVAVVELLGIVVWGFLGAHVVDCGVEKHVILCFEWRLVWFAFKDSFQFCDAGF